MNHKINLGPYSKKLLDFSPQFIERTDKIDINHPRILRVICQRPYFTGSGINLINLTRQGQKAGLDQFILFGQPIGDENPFEGIIDLNQTASVTFSNKDNSQKGDLSFPVAGMSDQMPYESTKFSDFSYKMLEEYLSAFGSKIKKIIHEFQPTIIHSHHLWVVSALCRVLAPQIPHLATCHNTALRQMELAPKLAQFVRGLIRAIDAIAVLNKEQRDRVKKLYKFPYNTKSDKIFQIIGQGINTDVFYPPKNPSIPASTNGERLKIVYVGKLSFAKGLPQLIEAFTQLIIEKDISADLYVIGSGEGDEKDSIIAQAKSRGDRIHFMGQLSQKQLAEQFRDSDIFILPSFYDGVPKVLLESLACGCNAIMSDIPGIKSLIQKECGATDLIEFIQLPRMKSIDVPDERDLPTYVSRIKSAILSQLEHRACKEDNGEFCEKIRLKFGWQGLFERYLRIYNDLLS